MQGKKFTYHVKSFVQNSVYFTKQKSKELKLWKGVFLEYIQQGFEQGFDMTFKL